MFDIDYSTDNMIWYNQLRWEKIHHAVIYFTKLNCFHWVNEPKESIPWWQVFINSFFNLYKTYCVNLCAITMTLFLIETNQYFILPRVSDETKPSHTFRAQKNKPMFYKHRHMSHGKIDISDNSERAREKCNVSSDKTQKRRKYTIRWMMHSMLQYKYDT